MKEYNRVKEKEIEDAVMHTFNVSRDQLYSKNRKRTLVDARRCVMYLFRNQLGYTLDQIGTVLNYDHATVMYHNKMMIHLVKAEPIKSRYKEIEKYLSLVPLVLENEWIHKRLEVWARDKSPDDPNNFRNMFLKQVMDSIVWEEKGTTRKNLERLLTTNFN